MTLRSQLKKAAAAVVAAASLFAVGVSTANALDTGGQAAPGSITVYKRSTSTKANAVAGTGAADQTAAGVPLKGVEFKLQKLDTAKVEGGSGAALKPETVNTATDNNKVADIITEYGDGSDATAATTDANGMVKFGNLEFGYYLLYEASTPEGYDVSAPSVITLPYASEATDNSGAVTYNTDVTVYPKNVKTTTIDHTGKTALGLQDLKNLLKGVDLNAVTNLKGPGQVVGENDLVAYDLVLDHSTYTNDLTYVELVDNVPTVNGKNILNLDATKTKVFGEKADGSFTEINENTGNPHYTRTDPTGVDASATGNITWSIGTKGDEGDNAEHTQDANIKAYVEAGYTKFHVIAVFSVNSNINDASSLENTADGMAQKKTGKQDPDKSDPVSNPVAGVLLVKTDASDSNTPTRLANAKFKISATYEDATAGTYIKATNGVDDKESTSAATTGLASFGGLAAAAVVPEQADDYSEDLSKQPVAAGDRKSITDFVNNVTFNAGETEKSRWFRFWVTETQAAEGYRKLQAPFAVQLKVTVLNDGNKTTKIEQVTPNISSTVGGTTPNALRVINVKNGEDGGNGVFKLPNTGGVGTVLLTLAGVALIVFAVVFLRRRRNEEER